MVDKNKMMESLSKNLPQSRQPIAVPEQNKDVIDDYDFSRDQYRSLLDKGDEALTGMLQLAAESEHPRAYEVLSGMMKNMADITDKLMDLQKKKKELTKLDAKTEELPQLTQNNVFVGSTTDLQRMLLKADNTIDVDPDE